MPSPTKDEVIRASESIKKSTAKLEKFAIHLAIHGLHEEAQALDATLKRLKKSLARIQVSEDGEVNIVD